MITADQLKDVMDRADALHRYLNIDQKQVEFDEEQLRTQAPAVSYTHLTLPTIYSV